MSYKRPRKEFEADLQSKESPFVTYGTPLPPLDSEARDDGSYVPIWKQEVTDERGRKRLHGAFTGGFSAGYFNTVGSKEGWTPSSFVSSRSNRRKDDEKQQKQQRPEDFMDDEDLAEAAEAQALQTNETFAGFGSTADDAKRKGMLIDLFRTDGDTIGVKLLRKMGWRDGQGIGPRVRRKAKVDDGQVEVGGDDDGDDHLFAPPDTRMISFVKKDDHKGLGFEGEDRLGQAHRDSTQDTRLDDDEDETEPFKLGAKDQKIKAQMKPEKSGFGIGVLNDTGSDDEDPYEVGPRISYNKVIGGDKKKKKAKTPKSKPVVSYANPLVASKPVFISKKGAAPTFRKCHDGRLPIDGFLLGDSLDASSTADDEARYPRPKIPKGWQSSKVASTTDTDKAVYQSIADAAKLSKLDAKSRAEILGEAQLPGKSVFDFLSSSAREKIASATGRTNLPQALNEAIPGSAKTDVKQSSSPGNTNNAPSKPDVPELAKETALAALGRGTAGWTPYASEPAKSQRYRSLLEYRAGLRDAPPTRPSDLKPEAWQQELREFAHAAEVFKPMTGLMASRFTSSSSAPKSTSAEDAENTVVLENPNVKAEGKRNDPAEEAARLGMFGPMTRSVRTFFPTRLVCKRFGVRPPEHVVDESKADEAGTASASGVGDRTDGWKEGVGKSGRAPDLVGRADMDRMRQESSAFQSAGFEAPAEGIQDGSNTTLPGQDIPPNAAEGAAVDATAPVKIDAERNDALESKRAGEELFRAIFGDDDDEDDDDD